ncbi:MAG: hypothetical protein JKY53_13795 [Flavobacteriales bacterium]|nr:hypothetical protein [Flavobacteriales bacterium]
MAKDIKTIIQEIEAHLVDGCGGGNYSDYYIGITKSIQNRLFGDHKVPKKGHCRIHREASNDTDARAVEKHFFDKGMQGAGGGGDEESIFIYAYKVSSLTVESLEQ